MDRNVWMAELTKDEFGEHVREGGCVIVPFGSLEEHGPHLPLGTDSIQPVYVVEEVARRTASVVAPLVPYGNCVSTASFSGTLSLATDTVRCIIRDITSELYRHGIRRVAVVSGHAGSGHMAALKDGVRQVVMEHRDLRALVLTDYDFAYKLIGSEGYPDRDGHAGTIETARVMAIRPELVKKGLPGPSFPDGMNRAMIYPDPERFFPTGVIGGDPSLATARMGENANRFIVERLTELIEEL